MSTFEECVVRAKLRQAAQQKLEELDKAARAYAETLPFLERLEFSVPFAELRRFLWGADAPPAQIALAENVVPFPRRRAFRDLLTISKE